MVGGGQFIITLIVKVNLGLKKLNVGVGLWNACNGHLAVL